MDIPTYTPSKVSITIENNGQVITYTFPSVGTATLNIQEFPRYLRHHYGLYPYQRNQVGNFRTY